MYIMSIYRAILPLWAPTEACWLLAASPLRIFQPAKLVCIGESDNYTCMNQTTTHVCRAAAAGIAARAGPLLRRAAVAQWEVRLRVVGGGAWRIVASLPTGARTKMLKLHHAAP